MSGIPVAPLTNPLAIAPASSVASALTVEEQKAAKVKVTCEKLKNQIAASRLFLAEQNDLLNDVNDILTADPNDKEAKKRKKAILQIITDTNDEISIITNSLKNLDVTGSSNNSDRWKDTLPTDCGPMFVPDSTNIPSFFEGLQAKLLARNTPEENWFRILAKVTQGKTLNWVSKHILQLKPAPTWPQAKQLFAEEYSADDYVLSNVRELKNCRQKESSGAEHFRELEQLADNCSQDVNEMFFLDFVRSRVP